MARKVHQFSRSQVAEGSAGSSETASCRLRLANDGASLTICPQIRQARAALDCAGISRHRFQTRNCAVIGIFRDERPRSVLICSVGVFNKHCLTDGLMGDLIESNSLTDRCLSANELANQFRPGGMLRGDSSKPSKGRRCAVRL